MNKSLEFLDDSHLSKLKITPIAKIKQYNRVYAIKARVTHKTPIKYYKNGNGEGKYFSVNLHDGSGEIIATGFQNECTKFYDIIQIDKIYYISNFRLKHAKKKYTKNDYEIIIIFNTEVKECMEDIKSLPTIKYDFIPIKEITLKTPDDILDIVAVCQSATDVQEFTARNTGKLLKKREVTVVDDSAAAVVLTLWGEEAEKFDGGTHPVIAVKDARLTEFNGSKSLSSSMLQFNPDLPEAHKLRGWYDNGGADIEIINISARVMPTFDSGGNNEWITFSDAEARQLDKDNCYGLLGVLRFAYADNVVYKACPQEYCNKKLTDLENGLFRCEKCNSDYPSYKYKLLLTGNVSDPTGDQFITAFSEAAETMLGTTSAEISSLYENDKTKYVQMFEEVKFKTFEFKFRTKKETYKDEARLKTTVMNVQPVDYKDANARLISSIKSITGVEV